MKTSKPHQQRLWCTALLVSGVLHASLSLAKETPRPIRSERFLEIESISLWEDSAPGARGDSPADVPSVTVLRPFFNRINGSAVIVAPGGAYVGLASNLEGRQVADWFTARGVTAFVLNYRLGKRYPFPVALTDAQRAIRFVRANARRWGISTDKIGMIGFSAGGHLTAMAGTSFLGANEKAQDLIDRVSDRPDFMVLGYPAIAFLEVLPNGSSAYCELTKIPACDPKVFSRYVPDKLVRADTPPTFLYHTSEDELSAENSVRFYRALLAKKVPVELHIFGRGPHGSGLGNGDPQLDQWPTLLEGWLRREGFLGRPLAPIFPAAVDEGPLSLKSSIGRLLDNRQASALLERFVGPQLIGDPDIERIRAYPAGVLLEMDFKISDEKLAALDSALRALPH